MSAAIPIVNQPKVAKCEVIMVTRIRSKRSNRIFQSDVSRLEKQIQCHLAWRGNISLVEAADLLSSEMPFTFVLSSGFDKNHYILSFVSDKQVVKHKNIRILVHQGTTCFMNGGNGGPCAFIDDLIPACLNCSTQVCKPLM
ncbi:MAG: hypothetical protein KFB95_06575 [Simkaniaceae bacterium]|nr:MAG: hypothetical protein KFB95_06575 [Simkaniaceae bacterium]